MEVFATSEQQCEEDLMFLLELAATDTNLLVRYVAFINKESNFVSDIHTLKIIIHYVIISGSSVYFKMISKTMCFCLYLEGYLYTEA